MATYKLQYAKTRSSSPHLISSRTPGNAAGHDDQPNPLALSVKGWQKAIVRILASALDLDAAEIDMSSSLADLGTDSLIAPEILSCLKDALGVEISSVDFAAAVDVNSLCELVRADLGHSPSSSPVSPSSSSFNDYATATGFTGYWDQVYPRQLRTVAKFITEVFEKLGCRIRLFKPGETLPAVRGTPPKYQREVTRLWKILEEAGLVTARMESNNRVYIRGTGSFEYNMGAQEQSARLLSDFPPYSAAHGLLAHLGPHLAECLTGTADSVSLLFGSEQGRRLLDGFYGHAPDIRAATQLLCDFIPAAIHSAHGKPFQILEIGAGTGGTTRHLVRLLQATGLPSTYTYTDISVSLLARARKTDFKDVDGMIFQKLNVEEEPPQELKGQYHAVVSSNCVHATRDARQCLRNTRSLLRPQDGFVALLELIQRLPRYDLVWGPLDGWWIFDDGRQYPLQTPGAWERAMLDSGFAHVDWSEGSSRQSRTLGIIAGFAVHEQEQRLMACPAKATSMLVYRGPSSSSLNRTLFLAPDGAGYGTIFNHMAQLLGQESLSLSVYALNNPFTTTKPALCSEHHVSSVA